jgi:hypothetical protein
MNIEGRRKRTTNFPPKGQYLSAKQHGVTPQNTIIFTEAESTTFMFTGRNKNWFYKASKPKEFQLALYSSPCYLNSN